MTLFKRLLIISSVALLGGCASVEHKETVNNVIHVSPNIAFPPAIDVPYSDVVKSDNTGLTVRWGGKVVASSKFNDTHTRLTIAALPLAKEGHPVEIDKNDFKINYFVVDLNDNFSQGVNFNDHFVTLYGDIAKQQFILINNQLTPVPSINLREIVDWNLLEREQIAYLKRQDPAYFHNVRPHTYSRNGFGHGFNSGFGHSSRSFRRF